MKAWTLFFVILFSSIYEQHHISTKCITDNGFLHNRAKTIVKEDHDFTWIFTEAVQKKITAVTHTAGNGTFCFHAFENNQKLTPITTGTGIEISAEINGYPSIKIKPNVVF